MCESLAMNLSKLSSGDLSNYQFLNEKFDTFKKTYSPLFNPEELQSFRFTSDKAREISNINPGLVWTVKWIEDHVAFPGFSDSGEITGYLVCKVPYDPNNNIEQVTVEREYTCADCDGEGYETGCNSCKDSGIQVASFLD